MEHNEPLMDIGDKCNGNCPPKSGKQTIELDNISNIDDISTPSDLKFDQEFDFEDPEIIEKRKVIEKHLSTIETVTVEEWQNLARSKGGLISDDYRKIIWPLLLGVQPEELTKPPSLEELATHSEYSQVVLDVGRSLKRFPPGVPYAQRVALQDQLTVLILRVMMAYPALRYYQGYHDVAITLLLVVGARAAFPLLARLSGEPGAPLEPFMRPTMAPAQHRLNHLLPLLREAHTDLAEHLYAAEVGTMFALPWFLTWFGHSLPRYADVVRLYDYFLVSPPLMPVYVTAAVVLRRARELLAAEPDMATLHCLLSRLPDSLPFEDILVVSARLYERHPPESLREAVEQLEADEEAARRREEERRRAVAAARRARAAGGAGAGAAGARWRWPAAVPGLMLAAAAALLSVYVYYRPELQFR